MYHFKSLPNVAFSWFHPLLLQSPDLLIYHGVFCQPAAAQFFTYNNRDATAAKMHQRNMSG